MPNNENLPVDDLVLDGGTQSRAAISEETVEEYVEVLDGAKNWPFPNLDVFHDGCQYLVAAGFHRTLAARRAGRKTVPCNVHQGTAWDALLFGMASNNEHGLRPSQEDRRHSVELLLDRGEKLTQQQIADISGVGLRTVQRIVAERRAENPPLAGSGDPFGDDDPFVATGVDDDSGDQELPPPPSTESDDAEAVGEPPEKSPEELFRLQRSKTIKTAESLSRAISDLNDLKAKPRACDALKQRVYSILEELKDW